jgi:hypothetical protein
MAIVYRLSGAAECGSSSRLSPGPLVMPIMVPTMPEPHVLNQVQEISALCILQDLPLTT